MDSVSPVLTEAEVASEQVIALDQPEYYPIVVLRAKFSDGGIGTMTRYRFSERERHMIACGADLLLTQPHHGPLMPVGLQLAFADSYPEPEA